MVVFNYSGKEINAKIVYYGPGLSGKTTNLERIYGHVPEQRRGKMVSMKTRSDRTLFFDFLPVNAGEIRGFRTRFLLYTVPGQVHYNATRKLVLKGTDAIIFVADSDPALRQANIESMQNLEQNLAEYQLSVDKIPVILQYNKRDHPKALTVDELNKDLNARGWPWFEAVAVRNDGVWETFRAATKALFESLERTLGGESAPKASSHASPPPSPDGVTPVAGPSGGTSSGGDSGSRDVDSTVDDVVRLSGSLESWSEQPAEGSDAPPPEAKPVQERGAAEAAPTEEIHAEAATNSVEGGPLGVSESVDHGIPAIGAEGPDGYLDSSHPLPLAKQPRDHETLRPEAPRVAMRRPEAPASPGAQVVRVPVEIDGGSGTVRVEIALEITLVHGGKGEPSAEPVGALDSGTDWK